MNRSRRALPQDATASRLHERESLRGLRATIERAPVGIAHFNEAGRFLFVNDQLCRILGRSRAELLSTTFQSITHPDDLEECLAQTDRVGAGELASYTLEKRFVNDEGVEVWTRVTVLAVRDDDGALAFFIGFAEDVTPHRAHAGR